jgi:hypothetical protein
MLWRQNNNDGGVIAVLSGYIADRDVLEVFWTVKVEIQFEKNNCQIEWLDSMN